MIKVLERLYVGNENDCTHSLSDFVVVHACKHPCHIRAVGYHGNLPQTHPNYLSYTNDDNLYLNMIDPPFPLFKIEMFLKYMEFVKIKWDEGRSILIHCNQGESRAPSLALLFIAKNLGGVNSESFKSAKKDFIFLYPAYNPGKGIQMFLKQNWHSIA